MVVYRYNIYLDAEQMRSEDGKILGLHRFRNIEFDMSMKRPVAYVQWAVDKWSEPQERDLDQRDMYLREMLQR